MILVMDVGNTNISIGIYKEDHLEHHWRMKTDTLKTEDEYAMQLKTLFMDGDLSFKDIQGIIISSVVPPIMFSLETMCRKYFSIEPIVVGPGVKTGLNIKCENPREIGADRIVNAVGAIQEYGAPIIVVDFGTATTYCYINENKEYMGGAIAPGMTISMEALFTHCSKLPRIEIATPQNVIGKNTVSSMQAGIVYGYVGQVEGIIGRIRQQDREDALVIATGGLANLVAKESTIIDIVDPFLTLKGLNIIYKRNHEEKEKKNG
ncbi:type III pantothenate kinase [Rummeliibacillus suwonensis]|jgi:type III pantothenate kinase|uniref:type III pantothenate kinase n=1 Tax=Rummeliibacillus suwonensis TaxID=1306154 RepID=UPI0011B6811B|nr:type III pantothenate kinase [Rummeliibacillus suwonensis]MBO2536759.1 type III pantothenate kinase [Rummeliibacillus suwonensis]